MGCPNNGSFRNPHFGGVSTLRGMQSGISGSRMSSVSIVLAIVQGIDADPEMYRMSEGGGPTTVD